MNMSETTELIKIKFNLEHIDILGGGMAALDFRLMGQSQTLSLNGRR